MWTRQPWRPRLFAWALIGVAVTLSACGNDERTASMTDNRAVGTSGSVLETKNPIDLTGCLQQADGSFVLTQINRPEPNAVPTDKERDGSVADREQLHAAQHAYRLSADNGGDLKKLVGKQVKVHGTVIEKSDLIAGDERRGNDLMVGTPGSQDKNHERRERAKIDPGDLARVDVASIEKVAESCGNRSTR